MSRDALFQAIMNGEDTLPDDIDISVEINVIEKECEAIDNAEHLNEVSEDLKDDLDVSEKVEEQVQEAEMLIKILRTDGISPIALRILSTNQTYTDVWKVGLPSVESLSVSDNNQIIANQIADVLQIKVNKAYEGLSDLWDSIVNRASLFFTSFLNLFRNSEKAVTAFAKKVEGITLNEEKINSKQVKYWDLETVKSYTQEALDTLTATDKIVVDLETGKASNELGEKVEAFIDKQKIKDFKKEKTKKPIADVAEDIIKGTQGEFYKTVITLNNLVNAYKGCLDKIETARRRNKDVKTGEQTADKPNIATQIAAQTTVDIASNSIADAVTGHQPDAGAAVGAGIVLLVIAVYRFITNWGRERGIKLMKAVVSNYIDLAKIVYMCKA